jgi:hypothetical protein
LSKKRGLRKKVVGYWRAENGNGKIPAAEWRQQVVILHLQQRFDGLELRDKASLYGIRHDTAKEINKRFYNPQQLRGRCLQSA